MGPEGPGLIPGSFLHHSGPLRVSVCLSLSAVCGLWWNGDLSPDWQQAHNPHEEYMAEDEPANGAAAFQF